MVGPGVVVRDVVTVLAQDALDGAGEIPVRVRIVTRRTLAGLRLQVRGMEGIECRSGGHSFASGCSYGFVPFGPPPSARAVSPSRR